MLVIVTTQYDMYQSTEILCTAKQRSTAYSEHNIEHIMCTCQQKYLMHKKILTTHRAIFGNLTPRTT